MATYPIRQLADNGGTAQFVPVTAPEAVQFPDGSNLNTFIGSVATIESNPVAANHAVGEFLCINGQVYEVIDAITAGDSISLGENVQVTNLGSQITALNNGLTDVLEWKTLTAAIGSNTTRTIPVDASEIHEILVEGWYYGESETTIRTTYVFDGQTVIQNNWFLDIFVANTRLYCRIVINGTSLTVSGYTSNSTGNRIVLKYR